MNGDDEEYAPRRILVALDASAPSLVALEAAADLAARMQADLLGLFVEDIDLVRLADFPFAPHLGLPWGAGEPLDAVAMEAQLRAVAAEARAALAAAALRRRVNASLRVVRGSVVGEVLAAAGEADLLILGWASRPLARPTRPGRTARAAAEGAPASVLLLPPGAQLGGPVLLVLDEGEGSRRSLRVAVRLAAGGELVLLPTAGTPERAREIGERAAEALERRGLNVRVRPLDDGTLAALERALGAEPRGVLLVAPDSPVVREGGMLRLLDALGCPVLITR